ncbi:MAG: methionyl-tRNA formyltransferase [Bacteroidales bacterium]
MDKKELRIVYMGTPEFAVESLKQLVDRGYNIVGVVTMPDKPAGRGQKIKFSAVKEYALTKGIKILQPQKLKDESFLSELRSLNASLQIVVAFRMLPEVVWNMPLLGTFNLHASLLPQYRGAAPINWAIINGDTESGATTFFLTHEIDTGKIIMQRRTTISNDDCAGSLHDRLMVMGADMVTDTVDAIITTDVKPIEQNELRKGELRTAPKIFKDNCKIDWKQNAGCVRNLIRGLSPYPGAWSDLTITNCDPITVKIYECNIVPSTEKAEPGSIKSDGKHYIEVACGTDTVHLTSIQLPGKKRLTVEELLRGFSLPQNSRFI